MPQRRFPPPWPPRKPDACFIVREATGKELGHFYFEDEPRTPCGGQAAHRDEARRTAANFAKLPELLKAVTTPALGATGGLAGVITRKRFNF